MSLHDRQGAQQVRPGSTRGCMNSHPGDTALQAHAQGSLHPTHLNQNVKLSVDLAISLKGTRGLINVSVTCCAGRPNSNPGSNMD